LNRETSIHSLDHWTEAYVGLVLANVKVLRAISEKRNTVPLPSAEQVKYGIRLPPERFTLTAENFTVEPERAGTKRQAEDDERAPRRPFEREESEDEDMEPEEPAIPQAIGQTVVPVLPAAPVGQVAGVDEDYDE